MFIEAGRSAWRTPAGCNVGQSLIRGLMQHIAPRWGAAIKRPPVYKHRTSPRCLDKLKFVGHRYCFIVRNLVLYSS